MFNPFGGKNIRDLAGEDLAVLRSVSEGWFIEYKSKLIDARSIGKSLSAFANHEGGWLFLGIATKDNQASDFKGIPYSEMELAERRLREGAAQHCSPSPYYEKKFIHGPFQDLGLAENHVVVVVCIPRSQDTPHVHSSGRIYRRIDSASEPEPETNRNVLDVLWSRRKAAAKRLRRFCLWRPETSRGEAEATYLHFSLMADPFGDHELSSTMGLERFREIMHEHPSGGLSFDDVYPCQDGAVARHISINDPFGQLFTFRYYWNGNARITVPVNSFQISDNLQIPAEYSHVARSFAAMIHSRGYIYAVVIDLSRLLTLVGSIVQRYRFLLSEDRFETPRIFSKLVFQRVWRRVPFLDSTKFVDYMTTHGIPLVEVDELVLPEDGVIVLARAADHSSGPLDVDAMTDLFLPIAEAFGIPRALFAGEESPSLIQELVEKMVKVRPH